MNLGPPKNVEGSALWIKLTERPRPKKVIDFPTKDGTMGELALWVLTESELHAARAAADAAAKEFVGREAKPGDLGYEEIYRNELAFQLVCIACRDVEDVRKPAFLHPKLARKLLTTDEIAVLAQAYALFRVESGPMIAELTEPEMEAWIRVLQEGGSRVPLALLSSEAMQDLSLYLARKLATLQMVSGSAGSPPEEPSLDGKEISPPIGSDLVDDSEKPVT